MIRSRVDRSAADFAGTLVRGDFERLTEMLAADVRMRALTPLGLVETSGAADTVSKFASWFGDADEVEFIRSGGDRFADRLHFFYRLRVRKPGEFPKLVEQHLLCASEAGRVNNIDLVCAGFRPETGWMMHRPGS